MNKVLIYQDSGVGPRSFRRLFEALRFYLPEHTIQAVNHSFFTSPEWEKATALLVFPGGRDLLYHHKLHGIPNARIQSYVKNGGRFLGICAGAYYGAAYVEFEKGGALEVCGSRELAFFPGKAVGPVYGNGIFNYDHDSGVRALFCTWENGAGYLYYNGGCFFEVLDPDQSIEVVAQYRDLPHAPAAVVYCPYGKGAAILSGIHPEYSFRSPNAFFRHLINKIFSKI